MPDIVAALPKAGDVIGGVYQIETQLGVGPTSAVYRVRAAASGERYVVRCWRWVPEDRVVNQVSYVPVVTQEQVMTRLRTRTERIRQFYIGRAAASAYAASVSHFERVPKPMQGAIAGAARAHGRRASKLSICSDAGL